MSGAALSLATMLLALVMKDTVLSYPLRRNLCSTPQKTVQPQSYEHTSLVPLLAKASTSSSSKDIWPQDVWDMKETVRRFPNMLNEELLPKSEAMILLPMELFQILGDDDPAIKSIKSGNVFDKLPFLIKTDRSYLMDSLADRSDLFLGAACSSPRSFALFFIHIKYDDDAEEKLLKWTDALKESVLKSKTVLGSLDKMIRSGSLNVIVVKDRHMIRIPLMPEAEAQVLEETRIVDPDAIISPEDDNDNEEDQ